MIKYAFALLLCIWCIPAHGQLREYCGKWRYARFEYAGRVTTDCKALSQDFENTDIKIEKNFFSHTYSIDNTPKQVDGIHIITVPMDEYENVSAITILKDGQVIQKLYIVASDMIYVSIDGCRFYFKREY